MKTTFRLPSLLRRMHRLAALAIAWACAMPALAELGGAPTLDASGPTAAPPATWQMRQATHADGGVEREYLGADGKVFAVAWRSPHRPALSVLLGMRYATQMSRNGQALRQQGVGSHAMTAQSGTDFAVSASTTQRLSTGVAWLPQMLPPGVDPASLSVGKGA